MKFNVRDEDGNKFEVEEVTKQPDAGDCGGQLPQNEPAKATDDELSVEEIASLKKLASVAEKLISLIPADNAGQEPATTGDEDEDEDDDEEETVVETGDCGAMPAKKDSLKKSVGANESKTRAEDSVVEDAVSEAWAKRYGGKR